MCRKKLSKEVILSFDCEKIRPRCILPQKLHLQLVGKVLSVINNNKPQKHQNRTTIFPQLQVLGRLKYIYIAGMYSVLLFPFIIALVCINSVFTNPRADIFLTKHCQTLVTFINTEQGERSKYYRKIWNLILLKYIYKNVQPNIIMNRKCR
jgi:hypothetical protein